MAVCDSKLYFSRDVKVYIQVETAPATFETWEIPVLDGFSFSQASNSSEVTLAEMENSLGVSRRGKKTFNDSLAPVEWSFSTYVRPFKSVGDATPGAADSTAGDVHAVEEVLWALFAGPATRTDKDDDFNGTDYLGDPIDYFTYDTANTLINFDASNKSTLGVAKIFFVLNSTDLAYEIAECVVNEATINFDIDGIAMIEWSGLGSTISEGANPTADIYEGITSTGNFIRNRITAMSIAPVKTAATFTVDTDASGIMSALTLVDGGSGYVDDTSLTFVPTNAGGSGAEITYDVVSGIVENETLTTPGTGYAADQTAMLLTGVPSSPAGAYTSSQEAILRDSYDLTLTGGSVTLSNNITYITPEELGIVNVPFAHVTGTRSISGSFTNYLVTDASGVDKSADFWKDLLDLTTVVTHDMALSFKIGGGTLFPRVELNMPHAHVEIPTHSIEDVISVETNFTALGTCINATDELNIDYYAE